VSPSTCPRCGEEGWFRPMEWKLRVMVSLAIAFAVFVPGLALTMMGIGLPLLIASPFVAILCLFLPWKRCHRCGHITIR
jgi:Na+/proline symporter